MNLDSWQETYYMFATFGALAGVVSCLVTVSLFLRTRPDRMKSRVEEAIAPLTARITKVEIDGNERDRKREQEMQSLDADLSARIQNVAEEFSDGNREVQRTLKHHGESLASINSKLDHGAIKRDEINGLHHRVTEVAKQVAGIGGQLEGVARMTNNINDYLRGKQ